ncbi:peptidoglycan-binding domain-containing protein [Luteimonas huabeiensis]|uniref:peptidoglycan-binding domain-containing protein n=1 Tax=Luteimonas huabeiensis TaxID=1244513 RepID=UPI0004672B28|nr:peptidoglycan-binding domain-containing protein [Luteimonas huabeiensis]
MDGWHLGMTSARYETGGRGAGTISSGRGDHGGASYGTYQLSSRMGTLQEFLDQSPYGARFQGLTPTSDAFDARWRELARTDPQFAQAQHDFIKSTHYDVQVRALSQGGLDLGDRGPAVQDALWSTAVQYRDLTPGIFRNGLRDKFGESYDLASLSDRQIVEAVQDYKHENTQRLFRSSPQLWDALRERALAEKADLIELAEGRLPRQGAGRSDRDPQSGGTLRMEDRGEAVRSLQSDLRQLGFDGADGRPLAIDGDFGRNTDHAVRAFQQAQGLDVDGIVGPETRKALERAQQEDRQQDAGTRQTGADAGRNGLDALMEAAKRGDVAAMRAAMTDFAASPQGREWLQQGETPCQAPPSRQPDAQQPVQAGMARS